MASRLQGSPGLSGLIPWVSSVFWVSVLTFGLGGCSAVRSSEVSGSGLVEQVWISPEQIPLNHFQFFGSHNSYKTAMSEQALALLRAENPEAALALEYWHDPLATQLDFGLRVLELDVFYDPQQRLFERGGPFPVLHVQNLDTGSHCAWLLECLEQVIAWSTLNPDHEPILISFNAKTDAIGRPGFTVPRAFDAEAWQALDALLRNSFGGKLLNPAEVLAPDGPVWPSLAELRGKFLLLLDEGQEKQNAYLSAVSRPVMFLNLPADDPRAAIRVLNDPIGDAEAIRKALSRGQLVRTRADADTREARLADSTRRDAAFASGAHFVSTDYYRPAAHFGSDYVVVMPGGGLMRCNPRVGSRAERKLCERLTTAHEHGE